MKQKEMIKCVFSIFLVLVLIGTTSCKAGNDKNGYVVPLETSIEVKKDASDSSVKISIDENFTLSVGMANECVGTICWLAGFDEYQPQNEDFLYLKQFNKSYFEQYKNDKAVKKAIRYYKKLRRKGFSYDAPAQFATYITPDCHFWRTDYENVKKMASDRNKMANHDTFGNLDELLKVTADFYDAVDYAHFYKTYSKFYKRLLQLDEYNTNLIKNIEINYAEYFHQPMDRTVLNFSIFEDNNNYGCHFYDGEKSYFEPKYSSGLLQNLYGYLSIIVHELCHPVSNVVAEKMYENPKIKAYLNNYITGNRKKTLASYAYGSNDNYLYELITRANTIRVLSRFMNEDYVYNNCIVYDIQQGFDAVIDVAEMVKEYESGEYNNFEDFETRLTELYIQKFCNGN